MPITVDIKGYDKLWLFGDKFLTKTYAQYQHLTERGEGFYMTQYFDVQDFTSNASCNLLARMRNLMVNAINRYTLLPKYIVVILETDLADECKYDDFGMSHVMGTSLKWLANEYHRIILAHKDKLPEKAKKFNYPQILWISPPRHALFNDNNKRKKFDSCLAGVAPLFPEMNVLRLKQKWEFNDGKLAVVNQKGEYRITSSGYNRYWEAIDNAIQYWDTRVGVSDKPRFFIRENQNNYNQFNNGNRYKWHNTNAPRYQRNTVFRGPGRGRGIKRFNNQRDTDEGEVEDLRFKLPTPPPRKQLRYEDA